MTEWRNDPYFAQALEPVFLHEGGFSNDPADPGGATQFGISLRFLGKIGDTDGDGWAQGDLDHDGDVDIDDIRALSRDDAAELYFSQFWERYRYADLSPAVGAKVFDFSVNMGPRSAHRLLQRAVRGAGGPALVDDGVIGPKTLDAVSGKLAGLVVIAMRSEAAGYYRVLVARNNSLRKFLKGWLNRAYA